jgi:hypothetical protein
MVNKRLIDIKETAKYIDNSSGFTARKEVGVLRKSANLLSNFALFGIVFAVIILTLYIIDPSYITGNPLFTYIMCGVILITSLISFAICFVAVKTAKTSNIGDFATLVYSNSSIAGNFFTAVLAPQDALGVRAIVYRDSGFTNIFGDSDSVNAQDFAKSNLTAEDQLALSSSLTETRHLTMLTNLSVGGESGEILLQLTYLDRPRNFCVIRGIR